MKHLKWFIIGGFVLTLIDEVFKYLALSRLPEEGSLLIGKVFALGIHKNYGIAFDIPFARELTIFITVLLVALFIHGAIKFYKTIPTYTLASMLIVAGALGNLFDRIVYGFTVDYMILFSRSAINISDLLIITGVAMVLLGTRKKQR